MKKAIIKSGNKQYLVAVGDQLAVDKLELKPEQKEVSFNPLLLIDGDQVAVGQPQLETTVTASVVEPLKKAKKVIAIRFKAKKRVHKRRGQRPQKTILEISQIK